MMDLGEEIQKAIIDSLQKTVPTIAAKLKGSSSLNDLIDPSTAAMGFSKITKPGVMVR